MPSCDLAQDIERALSHQRAGRLVQAEQDFRWILESHPGHAEAHFHLGNVHHEQGRLDKATECFAKAVEADPDHARAHYNLGIMHLMAGNGEAGATCHRRAVSLEPENRQFWVTWSMSIRPFPNAFTKDAKFESDLLVLLDQPYLAPSIVTDLIMDMLRRNPEISTLLNASTVGPFIDTAKRLSAIPLLLRILGLSKIIDKKFEVMLTGLRRAMILAVASGEKNNGSLAFSAALALHCFFNEYVFTITAEEEAAVVALGQQAAELVENDLDIPPLWLAALGAYQPLYGFPWAETLIDRDWPNDVKAVLIRQITEPLEERSLRAEIPSFGSIKGVVSKSVRAQYEENPYPRWIQSYRHHQAKTIGQILVEERLPINPEEYHFPENPDILVAGGGTGLQPIEVESRILNARVQVIDFSLSSLAYAKRKTQELGLTNMEFTHGDLLDVGNLNRQFDYIECLGVLHHMDDPIAGWKALKEVLKPGGFMKIGLYSELARTNVVLARDYIAEQGYKSTPSDIRRLRQDIIAMDDDQGLTRLAKSPDFYSLSDCRDLLFHVQEHRFTLPLIGDALKELDLDFLGFELRTWDDLKNFQDLNPDPQALTSLPLWHTFEEKHPGTFIQLYKLWCYKK